MGPGPAISGATAQARHPERASPGGDDACAANESPAGVAQLVHALLPNAMAARDCIVGISLLRGRAATVEDQPSWCIYGRRSRRVQNCMVSARIPECDHKL